MPTLYIHAGMPKTGTTSLQSFLRNNRAILAEHAKLYYPETGILLSKGYVHYNLFPVRQELWDSLGEEVAPFKDCDIVLSKEGIWVHKFQDLLPPALEIIQHTFPGYTIKLVAYVRRLDDFMKSFFNQRTKGGNITACSYAEFFQQVYDGGDGTLFFSQPLATAVNLLGEKNALFRLYDRNTLHGKDIITDFFNLLGREIPKDVYTATSSNPSLPDTALPFLSKALLPLPSGSSLRNDIVNIARQAYTFPDGSDVGKDRLTELEQEIDKIDAYLPGYRQLFAERKLSFSLPEVDVKDPQALFIAALLYRLLMQQNGIITPRSDCEAQLTAVLSSKSWRYTAPLRHTKKMLKAVLNKVRQS